MQIGGSFQAEPISMKDIKEEQCFMSVFLLIQLYSPTKKRLALVFLSQTHSAESCLASQTTWRAALPLCLLEEPVCISAKPWIGTRIKLD